jgi:hypothetical protein
VQAPEHNVDAELWVTTLKKAHDLHSVHPYLFYTPLTDALLNVFLLLQAPEDDADAALWMSNLIKAEYQGCGHIRLMIEEPTRPEYSVLLTGDEVAKCESTTPAASCVDSKTVAQYLIGKFFRCGGLCQTHICVALLGVLCLIENVCCIISEDEPKPELQAITS